LEVQGRARLETRRLSDRAAAAWALRWPALALATVVTVAALVVDAQPLRSPWWTYADADASYSASALNLMLGRDVTFVDHPGLPITEAVAVAFGVEALFEEGSLAEAARLSFVDRTLLDLDSARSTFRGFAVVFYMLGALLAFFVAARLFGHWTWGLASGLLWIVAPGLGPMSIQLRPDVLLAVLVLLFAFAIARAAERRSAAWFAGAAAVVGFTTMVKLHALALLPALAVAALWRAPPEAEVDVLPRRGLEWGRRHRLALATLASVWLVPALLINAARMPFRPTAGQIGAVVLIVAGVAAAFGIAELVRRLLPLRPLGRVVNRFAALVIAAFAAGLLLPVTVSVPEGLRALVYLWRNLSGSGVQEGIEPFSTPLSSLDDLVGSKVLIVFLVGLLAGMIGVVRRDARPAVWMIGALSMGAMAYARPPNVHYFASSFVLAALAMLWLLQREPRARTSFLVWPVVLWLAWPSWEGRAADAAQQERFAALVAPAKAYVEPRLAEGEIAVVPSYWPFADARYFELVEIYVEHTPPYPYRYLPTTAGARSFAAIRGFRPRFFVSPEAAGVTAPQRAWLGELGEYTIAPVPASGGLVAEIQQGPGVTEPW
jgi:hypothetical protein